MSGSGGGGGYDYQADAFALIASYALAEQPFQMTRSGPTELVIRIRRGGDVNCGQAKPCSSSFAAEASMHPKVYLDLYNVCFSNPGKSTSLLHPVQVGMRRRAWPISQRVRVLTSNTSS